MVKARVSEGREEGWLSVKRTEASRSLSCFLMFSISLDRSGMTFWAMSPFSRLTSESEGLPMMVSRAARLSELRLIEERSY